MRAALVSGDLGAAYTDARCRCSHSRYPRRPPRQGDGDEGRALVVDDPERDPWATVLARVVHSWVRESGGRHSLAPSKRLFSAQLGGHGSCTARNRPHRFADAGMVILRSRPQDGPEIWCRCDGGPHGFLSIAAHAHADALSLEVRHDGVDILADPGTYCYHGEPPWREWFRSTAAHNTIEIGGVSQAESGGPFLWTNHPRTATLACDVGEQPVQTWCAKHDGYLRLSTPAVHRRSVTLNSPGRRLIVMDTVEATAEVPLRLCWHLGPDIVVDLTDRKQHFPGRSDRRKAGQAHARSPTGLDHLSR